MAVTVVDVITAAAADPHNVTIEGAPAGQDLWLFVSAAATSATPSGWTLVASRVNNLGCYIFRLPAANHSGGDIAVALDHNGARAVAAVALASDPLDGTAYVSLVNRAESDGSTTWAAGTHTFSAREDALAVHFYYALTTPPAFTVTSYDSGFAPLADSGWAGTGGSNDEAVRFIIGSATNYGVTAGTVTVTLGTTVSGLRGETVGLLAFDSAPAAIELATTSAAGLTAAATGSTTAELAATTTAGLTVSATATGPGIVELEATTTAGLTAAATGAAVAELAATTTAGLTVSATAVPPSNITVLDTWALATADPHNITIPGATAGRDVYLVVNSPSVVTTPAGWTLDASRINAMGSYVYRLPGASNPGGNIAVTLDLGVARPITAAAFETPELATGSTYASLIAPVNAPGATAWGTGLHTFTTRAVAVAIYCFHQPAGATPPAFTVSSFDQSFTPLADTGWAGNGTTNNEGTRIILGARETVAFTNDGVVLTLSAAGPTGSAVGFLAVNLGPTVAQLNTTSSAGLTATATATPGTAELAATSSAGLTVSANTGTGTAELAATTTAGLTLSASAGNKIVAENALTGHDQTNFEFATNQWTRPGYADGFTYNAGETVPFKVDSAEAFTVEIFRLGYYAGAGARRVDTVTGTAFTQPAATINGTTGEADASNWTTNATWTIPADATSGLYIAFIRGATSGNYWRTPFVVREDARAADIIVKLNDTTWQAYNAWGGKDLYGTDAGFNAGARSSAVTYTRPIITERMRAQSSWANAEWPLIQFLERNGYNVKYVSCLDVDRDPTLLLDASVVISIGHDEYWSDGMWDAFVAARDAGVNLIFAGGNDVFWRVRFTNGRTRMVCYKDTLAGSPLDPVSPTGTFQDTRSWNTDRRPPASLIGSRFIANGIREDTLVVPSTYRTSPFWRNTTVATLADGDNRSYPGVLGFEWNGYFPDENEIPNPHVSLSATTVTLTNMMADINGQNYNLTGTPEHRMVIYRAGSGALVAGLGTVQWSWGLGAIRNRGQGYGTYLDIKQATYNLLRDMGAAPYAAEAGIVTSSPQTYFVDGPPIELEAVSTAGAVLGSAATATAELASSSTSSTTLRVVIGLPVELAATSTAGATLYVATTPDGTIHLLNQQQTLTRVRPTVGTDAYGNTTYDYGEGAHRAPMVGWLQQDNRGRAYPDGRGPLEQTWLLVTNTADITARDRIEWNDHPGGARVFTVEGPPEPAYRGYGPAAQFHHTEATLRILEG